MPTSSFWRVVPAASIALLLALAVGFSNEVAAQRSHLSPGSDFTVDDVLDLASARVQDLSADGRWLAVTVGSLRDRIGIDNYRYGDPTYLRPSQQELWVIDTRSGQASQVFSGKRNVLGADWSPDGRHLAILEGRSQRFTLWVWGALVYGRDYTLLKFPR